MTRRLNAQSSSLALLTIFALGTLNSSTNANSELSATNVQNQKCTTRFCFEVWKERIVEGLAAHGFLIIRDNVTGRAIAFSGLATNRKTGAFSDIGEPLTSDLKIWTMSADCFRGKNYELVDVAYQTGNPDEMLAKLIPIEIITAAINRHHLRYSPLGKQPLFHTVAYNSDNGLSTLMRAGKLPYAGVDFKALAPGWREPIISASFAKIWRVAAAQNFSRTTLDVTPSQTQRLRSLAKWYASRITTDIPDPCGRFVKGLSYLPNFIDGVSVQPSPLKLTSNKTRKICL